jgi:hypothetical protein
MNLFLRLRRWLARLILRGRLLDWWAIRRGRQWDAAYRAELAKTLSAPIAPIAIPMFPVSNPLRQILLIADCMWEQNDLVPELARIADTRLLDLRPALKTKSTGTEGRMVVVETIRQFAEANRALSPDVILFYLRSELLSDEAFELLRQQWKCPLFGMNLDDKAEFFPYGIFSSTNENYQHWAKKFDLNITNCLPATDWYRQRGLPCIYSPQGVHLTPELTLPTSANFKYRFSFLGSIKPERKFVVNQLLALGIPIQTFGSGWPGSRWADNPNAVFRSSQINLGIGFATPSLTLTTVKGRDFECPGVGACYLTTYNWELPQHYELGKEILCYRSFEELVEMYSWYHNRPEDCLKIAQAAWRRCSNEHTWEKRFRKIFRQTGLKCQPAGPPFEPR